MTALLTFVLITLVARLSYCAGRMEGLREAFTAIDRGEEAGVNAPSHVSRQEAARAA